MLLSPRRCPRHTDNTVWRVDTSFGNTQHGAIPVLVPARPRSVYCATTCRSHQALTWPGTGHTVRWGASCSGAGSSVSRRVSWCRRSSPWRCGLERPRRAGHRLGRWRQRPVLVALPGDDGLLRGDSEAPRPSRHSAELDQRIIQSPVREMIQADGRIRRLGSVPKRRVDFSGSCSCRTARPFTTCSSIVGSSHEDSVLH